MLPLRVQQAISVEERTSEEDARGPVGVVFVHGIGSQTQSETLRWMAAPLLEWLYAWHEDPARRDQLDGPLAVVASRLSYGDALEDEPANITLRLPAYRGSGNTGPATEWIFAEGWWAARVVAPPFLTMAVWALRIYGRPLGRLRDETRRRFAFLWSQFWRRLRGLPALRRSGWRAERRDEPNAFLLFIQFLSTLLLFLGYALVAFVGFFLVVCPLFIVAQIPVRPLQDFLVGRIIRPFLLENLGDFYTYLFDEVQARHIRGAVVRAVEWVAQRCKRVVIVAHSQGTVVALDALTSGEIRWVRRVRKLITIGGALNNAWDQAPARSARVRKLLGEESGVAWLDFWSAYDPVPGGPLQMDGKPVGAARSEEVVNGRNVLTDHDGYFRNREQFVSRLAQEIDAPDRQRSRFAFGPKTQREREERRIFRITALVGWRLAAMYLFAVAVAARLLLGLDRVVADGELAWRLARSLPGVEALLGGYTIPEAINVVAKGLLATVAYGCSGWRTCS